MKAEDHHKWAAHAQALRAAGYDVLTLPDGSWAVQGSPALYERLMNCLRSSPVAAALAAYCRSVPPEHIVTHEDGVEVTAAMLLDDLAGAAARYEAHLIQTAVAYLRSRR